MLVRVVVLLVDAWLVGLPVVISFGVFVLFCRLLWLGVLLLISPFLLVLVCLCGCFILLVWWF